MVICCRLGSLARCIDLKELIDNIQPGNCAEIQAEVITDIEVLSHHIYLLLKRSLFF